MWRFLICSRRHEILKDSVLDNFSWWETILPVSYQVKLSRREPFIKSCCRVIIFVLCETYFSWESKELHSRSLSPIRCSFHHHLQSNAHCHTETELCTHMCCRGSAKSHHSVDPSRRIDSRKLSNRGWRSSDSFLCQCPEHRCVHMYGIELCRKWQ